MPVASWNSILTLLTIDEPKGWYNNYIEYMLTFIPAPVQINIYMKIPKGFTIQAFNPEYYVLKLHQNMYRRKQPI